MNTITHYLSSPVSYALGWTLLHTLWQGFALVLSAALVLHVFRGRSSAARYRTGVLALLAQPLLSAGTFAWYYRPLPSTITTPSHAHSAGSLTVHWQTMTQVVPWHTQIQVFLDNHLSQFVLVYLIGVLLFGVRLAGGWLYLQHLNRTAVQPDSDYPDRIVCRLRSVLQIRPLVHIRESARIAVPMVVNSLKPVLLLPIGLATHLSIQELEAVLAHELAHVKRHDYAVNLIQSVLEVLYFFHPAIWWLSARIREEREHCCDDLAIQACGNNGRILAQALARVEEIRLTQSSQTPVLAMALTSKRQLLLHRVRRVLGVPTRPSVSNSSLIGLTLATLLLVSASVYAIQQQPKPSKPKPQSYRRLSAGNGTEFSVTGNNKIEYIIWKGQKLPASRVRRLQSQLYQVMSGTLSLNNILQADRTILLSIIETTHSPNDATNDLDGRVDHIDYNALVASAINSIPPDLNETPDEVANVDYNNLVHTALASVLPTQAGLDTTIQQDTESASELEGLAMLRRQDSLADQQELTKGKIALLRAQAQSQQFNVESVERAIERIERQKSVLEQKRFLQTNAQQQTILKSGFARTDSAQAALTRQIEAGELSIQKTETNIEALNQQLIRTQAELEKAQKPLRETEVQIRKLGYTSYMAAWSHRGAPARSLGGVASPIPAAPAAPPRLTVPEPVQAPDAVVPALPAPPSPASKRKK